MYDHIERFYETNKEILLGSSEGSLRPPKSYAKDVETCISKFVAFFEQHGNVGIGKKELGEIVGDLGINTTAQNIHVMQEFGFVKEDGQENGADAESINEEETDAENELEKHFIFTDKFVNFIDSKITPGVYILEKLYDICSVESISRYFNFLLCTLREAYKYGQVILFPDSNSKFQVAIPSPEERENLRKRIFDIYGFAGRGKTYKDDEYTPNISYMSRNELEKLGLLKESKTLYKGLKTLELTPNGFHLLSAIDQHLSNTGIDSKIMVARQGGTLVFESSIKSSFDHNRIVFGAPGTGKSYSLIEDTKTLLGTQREDDYERVTFHPDYSYANFVGTYKPVPIQTKDASGNLTETISYKYVPGPFMRVLSRALKNNMESEIRPFLLIIEEINRSNVAAVFGDIFQLLDRNDCGTSTYSIETTEDMKRYLAEELGGDLSQYCKIKIPNNMFIWATMNSADQGVFPMDTAFKRRWHFSYIGINQNDKDIAGHFVTLGKGTSSKRIEWNALRKAINKYLADHGVNEDKQLGPYFLSKNLVVPPAGNDIDQEKFINAFKDKVIMYLFEDAAKQKRQYLFEGCSRNKNQYSEICLDFDERGIDIFNREILNNISASVS